MPRREVVSIALAGPVMAALTKRAEICGLTPGLFVREIVESYVAGERCPHGAARPEAPVAEEPAADESTLGT
jgi:hypothetical protein